VVLYQNGREQGYMEQVLGKMVTEHDTMLCALHPCLDTLTDTLMLQNPQEHTNIVIATPLSYMVRQALNASSYKEQQVSIKLLEWIDKILQSFPNMNIWLLWLPRSIPFVAFKRTKQLALEAIRTANLADIEELHITKNQKKQTKAAAIEEWARQWHQSPHNSLAYQMALMVPLDECPHLSFHI
jgi:hypothetical protein